MTGTTEIMQTTPKAFFGNIIVNIPDMLDTAVQMLTTPEMIIVIIIGIFVRFLIYVSK